MEGCEEQVRIGFVSMAPLASREKWLAASSGTAEGSRDSGAFRVPWSGAGWDLADWCTGSDAGRRRLRSITCVDWEKRTHLKWFSRGPSKGSSTAVEGVRGRDGTVHP